MTSPSETQVEAAVEQPSTLESRALAGVLASFGCPQERAEEMAEMLCRRAKQLAARNGRSEMEALTHLVGLMRQGWAAKERGL